MKDKLHGLAAYFAEPGPFLAAVRRMREAGYTGIETFTPFPLEELPELLPGKPTPIGWIMLAAAGVGSSGAYYMQWYATHDYPINVGGRPLHSWPAFIPVTFELTILTAALAGLTAFLCLTRLPQLHHPMFSAREFHRASQDRFAICILAADPRFETEKTGRFLVELQPQAIEEVFT